MQKLVWENSLGDKVDLTSGNYGITEWEGFSNAPLNIQSQQVPFQDGGIFLDALMEQRELSVTLKIKDENNLENRYRMRRELIHILNPKLGEGYLIYTNDFTSKRIKCIPQIPLFKTHNSNDSGTPEASLAWTACEPYWEDIEETQVIFNINEQPTIKNEGDVPAQLKIDWLTSYVKNGKLTNVTQNQIIKYKGDLTDNLTIDTSVGQKKVTSNGLNFLLKNGCVRTFTSVAYSPELELFVAFQNCFDLDSDNPVQKGNLIFYTSKDGSDWVGHNIYIDDVMSDKKINDVKYISELNKFIAVGLSENYTGDGYLDYTIIITSEDGINWTKINLNSDISYNLLNVTYIPRLNKFVMTTLSEILSTSDFINWDIYNLAISYGDKISIAYNSESDKILVVKDSYIYSSEDAINWTYTVKSNETFKDIIYVKDYGMFIMSGRFLDPDPEAGAKIFTSIDGINWNEYDVDKPFDLLIYAQDSKTFVGICTGRDEETIESTFVYSSEDSIIWNLEAKINYAPDLGDHTYWSIYNSGISYNSDFGVFVLVGSSGIVVSNDMVNWVRKTLPFGRINKIKYFSDIDLFIMSSTGDSYGHKSGLFISEDGINWKLCALNDKIYDFIRNPYREPFVFFYCSYDSITVDDFSGYSRVLYTFPYIPDTTVVLRQFAYNSNILVICCETIHGEPVNKVVVFANGNFTEYSAWEGKSIVYNNHHNLFVMVFNKDISTSSDGIHWEVRENIFPKDMNYIIYNEDFGLYVAVGAEGTIMTSSDAINWNERNTEISEDLQSVTYSSDIGMFTAVGNNGTVLISSDCVNWTNKSVNLPYNFYSCLYSEKLGGFTICGDLGFILKSKFTLTKNEIQNLTADSDMNMNLGIGDNKFRINFDDGNMIVKLKYRQKYIGV